MTAAISTRRKRIPIVFPALPCFFLWTTGGLEPTSPPLVSELPWPPLGSMWIGFWGRTGLGKCLWWEREREREREREWDAHVWTGCYHHSQSLPATPNHLTRHTISEKKISFNTPDIKRSGAEHAQCWCNHGMVRWNHVATSTRHKPHLEKQTMHWPAHCWCLPQEDVMTVRRRIVKHRVL